jgi:fused signal recognition particle receptor
VATVAGPEPTVAGTPIAEPEAPIDEPVPTVAESAPVEPVATVAESAPVEPISPVAGQEASAGQSVESPEAEEAPEAKAGWFGRLRQKLYHGPEGPKDQGEQEPDEPQTQVGQTPSQAASKAELAPVAEGDQAGPGSQIEFAAEAAETRPQVEGDQQAPETEAAPEAKASWLGRLKQKLSSTREMLAGRLERALSAVRSIDDDVLDELEEIMITSDLGVKTTNDILNKIRGQVAKKELKDAVALKEAIRARIEEMVSLPLPTPKVGTPYVQLVIGVNGVGKTTTIAKLGHMHQNNGKKVLLAAGDTFRAAAVEQLTIWANRIKADIVSQPTGADPSAVVFDSLTAAKARGIDNVIIDTAGRLHTKVNLMDELKKIKRVADKALPGAPHETILVLDANTGQNAANQAQIFNEAIGVDSLIVTKLDGTSKGGVIVSIINEHKIPVKYIGIGENFEDLRLFDAQAFVEAIMGPKG